MLDLRTLDPARQSADRRVALVIGYGVLAFATCVAVLFGGGLRAVLTSIVLALGGIPWYFAFGGRWRLLDDALAGLSFATRGDRTGVWATAPVAGVLLTLLLVSGLPTPLALLVCMLGGAGYTALIAWSEQRYERAIFLDLTVLELRFERITDARAATAAEPRHGHLVAASHVKRP
jgi:hypothetical protein